MSFDEEWRQLANTAAERKATQMRLNRADPGGGGGVYAPTSEGELKVPQKDLAAIGDQAFKLRERLIKDGDLTDASWKKNWTYHLVGGAANAFGGKLGDPLQRGVDVVATAWLEEEQKRINDEATGNHQKTYQKRNEQLDALADQWYKVNKEWAEDPSREGYSQEYGVYSKIAAAANDGNQKAEGITGDQ